MLCHNSILLETSFKGLRAILIVTSKFEVKFMNY